MRTSATQFIVMVDFMERNGDLAKPTGGPRGRQWAMNKWRELSSKLNSDGSGETRSEEKWRKVWTDFKNNTKRKAAKLNRAMTGTGGGPALKISLTDLELRVLAIMGEQAATGMTTISEVGFDHVEPEMESQENFLDCEDTDMEKNSSQLNIGDEDWNFPGTSQEQPPPVPTPPQAPTPPPAKKKWAPIAKRTRHIDIEDKFLNAERDRDKMFYELERERLRQRNYELELKEKWLEFMKEALHVLKGYLKDKSGDE